MLSVFDEPVPSFYNTVGDTGAELEHNKAVASGQELDVLSLFKRVRRKLAPHQVHSLLFGPGNQTPLTSTRRAMTNLTSKELLVKTDSKTKSPSGRNVYMWELAGERSENKDECIKPI